MSNDLKTHLQHFTGTENWYRHPLFGGFSYTDGIRYLAEQAGAYWLIDQIFGFQYDNKRVKALPFQVWDLIVNEDRSAWLICTDGNDGRILHEKISFTDFPLPEIRLFLTDRVLLLPSEY